jgi:hypothetical protein
LQSISEHEAEAISKWTKGMWLRSRCAGPETLEYEWL